jgi:hypothetical protein
MHWFGRLALAPVFACLLALGASAAPDYIEANRDELANAYGEEVADRAFSDELTEARTATIKGSLFPEQECPDEPDFVLRDAYPYQVDPTDVIWIERYEVSCKENLHRAILMMLKDGEIQAVPMAPGKTITDPQLQVDAGNMVRTAAMTRSGEGCSEAAIMDTAVSEKPAVIGMSWKERWSVKSCDNIYDLGVTFTPSPDGGTNVAVLASE